MKKRTLTTIVQYERPVPPAAWDQDARRYAQQVDAVLTDIYRRYGRLRVEDLSEDTRQMLGSFAGKDTVSSLADIVNALVQRLNALESPSSPQNMMLRAHPVGSIFVTVQQGNPASLFGGTWAPWGAGRVPVGVDAEQAEFSAIESTGGEKTHLLTEGELPVIQPKLINGQTDVFFDTGQVGTDLGVKMSKTDAQTGRTARIAPIGGDQAHNNLQPYITCYMWKRTA